MDLILDTYVSHCKTPARFLKIVRFSIWSDDLESNIFIYNGNMHYQLLQYPVSLSYYKNVLKNCYIQRIYNVMFSIVILTNLHYLLILYWIYGYLL